MTSSIASCMPRACVKDGQDVKTVWQRILRHEKVLVLHDRETPNPQAMNLPSCWYFADFTDSPSTLKGRSWADGPASIYLRYLHATNVRLPSTACHPSVGATGGLGDDVSTDPGIDDPPDQTSDTHEPGYDFGLMYPSQKTT